MLAKVYASRFSVGELIFLFTADPHLDGDDPFPLQDENEALDAPLGLPDDEPDHALWRLRQEMLGRPEAEEAPTRADEAEAEAEAENGRGGGSRPPCRRSSGSRRPTSRRWASTSSPACWRGRPASRAARRRRAS